MILEYMVDARPQADRIRVAQLTGEARFRAKWRALTGDEEAAAVIALRELAGGRADLLAEVAGIFEGASEGQPDEPLARQAAGLCRLAGADPAAIPAWIGEGRRRRARAGMPPPSGGIRGPGLSSRDPEVLRAVAGLVRQQERGRYARNQSIASSAVRQPAVVSSRLASEAAWVASSAAATQSLTT